MPASRNSRLTESFVFPSGGEFFKAQRELEVHSGNLNFHISPFKVSTSNDTRWLYGVHLLRSSVCSSYSKSKTKTLLCRERLSLLYRDDVKENTAC